MALSEQLKSKKMLLGLGTVLLVVVGFFVFQAISSGESDQPLSKQRSKPASQTAARRQAPPESQEQPESPLFQAIQALKDPFREEDSMRVKLEAKLELTKKEVEYLKAALEEKQLRMEIAEIEKSLAQADQIQTPEAGQTAALPGLERESIQPEERIQVKAILTTDERRIALLMYKGQKAWICPGESLGAWKVERITDNYVVLSKEGVTSVFFYHRPGVTRQGES
jgi:type IV pilus biogenesis protein PilP